MSLLALDEASLENVALDLLRQAGWQTAFGPEIAPEELLAERTDYREVVLTGRLRSAVALLNPELPSDAVSQVVLTVLRAESQALEAENWRAYQLLVEGVPVTYRDEAGNNRHDKARLVDWDDVAANDLVAVNQFTVTGKSERRPDIVLFVNGLPLGLLELKKPGEVQATLRGAFNQIKTYRNQVPELFIWNQVTVISDGIQARAATYTAEWEHYAPWKTIDGNDVALGSIPQIEVLVLGLFKPEVFLDLIRNFIAVSGDGLEYTKKIAKYHQYWAVRKAVQRTIVAGEIDGRAGVVWHTQGSGKSLEMLFYAGKIMREPAMENPTLVVLTDRNDLDDQLFEESFAASKPSAPLPEAPVQAVSRLHLKELLEGRQSGGIIFSTIQKFGVSKEDREAGTPFPLLSDRINIVVMVDEAHRSNYDFVDGFARHLRDGLPNATFIGFTGTPIESSDVSTSQVFGEYIDIYDLTQAVEDGATVKVYYEPRLVMVELPAEAHDAIDDAFAEATSGTEDEARERLKTRWAQVEAIVGSDKRIKQLAEDVVTHWQERRDVLEGKAMVVTMSRRIAAALYEEIVALRPEWGTDDDATGVVKVVITGSASDDEALQPHIRNKERLRAIKARAKDPNDPLELVIVRDMWLTGFDSPSMHTMYVDKPMKGAGLMQAIARVNRTFKDKPSGLVVDYLGIAEDLKKALSDYTRRDRKNQATGEDIREKVIPAMLEEHGIINAMLHRRPWRETLAGGGAKAYLDAVMVEVDYLLGLHIESGDGACMKDDRCLKCRLMAHTRRLVQLYTAAASSPQAREIRNDVAFFETVRGSIAKIEGSDREGTDPGADLDTAIKQIVSDAMTGTGVIDIYNAAGLTKPDISLIDDSFVEKFKQSKNQNLQIEMLRRLLENEIKVVGKRNVVTGKRFSEMLGTSLTRYQNRTLDAAQVVAELVALAKQLRDEPDRAAELGLTNDELVFYDAICANESAIELGDDTLKAIAHDLVIIVRRDAKTDWSVKEQVRAKLRATIKVLLLRYGYPPDQSENAAKLVLEQAELFAMDAAA